jgi:hypothetical protein
VRPILDGDGALRGFMNKTYSEELQDEIEPIGMSGEAYLKATADSMVSFKHPIYNCKFWIYEEKRLAPYEEYMEFYRRLENGSDNKS